MHDTDWFAIEDTLCFSAFSTNRSNPMSSSFSCTLIVLLSLVWNNFGDGMEAYVVFSALTTLSDYSAMNHTPVFIVYA